MKSIPDKKRGNERMRGKVLMVMKDNGVKETEAEMARRTVSTEKVLKGIPGDPDFTETIAMTVHGRIRSTMDQKLTAE